MFVSSAPEPGAAKFTRLRNYDRSFELRKCIPLKDHYPSDVELRMDKDLPDDIELVESLYGPGTSLFVNNTVRQLFALSEVDNVEYLPLKIINHKGRAVEEPYFIVNILTRVDCIDTAQSQVEWNDINPDAISGVDKLIIDEAPLSEGARLVRPVHLDFAMLIHRSLAHEIQARKLRGFAFTEITEYTYP
jgi:hypothetical protein